MSKIWSKRKLSLRFHVFFAFIVVLLITLSAIILTFNLLVGEYIKEDARNKLGNAYKFANRELASHMLLIDPDKQINQIVQSIKLGTGLEVQMAIAREDYSLKWPDIYDDPQVVNTANKILQDMRQNNDPLGLDQLVVVDGAEGQPPYYVKSIELNLSTAEPYHLILFYDLSSYFTFVGRINQLLWLILPATLALGLLSSLVVSNTIIISINKLIKFASRIGSGDFRPQTMDFADKELDDLANDMNIMAARLDKADQEQKTFFQNASHELRTPLMSIQGYAEGIKYGVFDNQEAAADVIISESQRLTGMVENLLTISRLDTAVSGRQKIAKQRVDLKELLASVAENVQGAALLIHKNLKLDFAVENIQILANENDLFRAFENILSNGLRYAEKEVKITMSLKAPELVEIDFSDDGPGISKDHLDQVFTRFYRGEDGKHGIGLALVKAIITDHNGTVTARNKIPPEHGAIFTVELPTLRDFSSDADFTDL